MTLGIVHSGTPDPAPEPKAQVTVKPARKKRLWKRGK